MVIIVKVATAKRKSVLEEPKTKTVWMTQIVTQDFTAGCKLTGLILPHAQLSKMSLNSVQTIMNAKTINFAGIRMNRTKLVV